jgi:hypothetical protein
VTVKLEEGIKRKPQGNHSSTKGRPMPTFGENFLYPEAKSIRSSKKRSGDHGNAHFFQLFPENDISTFWGPKAMTNKCRSKSRKS